ncbi:MAG: sulfate permease [Candidatus Omnitrophica bacterium]|nr:sulfate permease [Candidatus Omnitrophota bacterium]
MQYHSSLLPKLVTVIREGYSLKTFIADLGAGVIVGIVALPLAIAFAIASGVRPEQGLYTAIVAGFIISALGGSRFQIGGPTGAFIVIVYGIVAQYGYAGLAVATLLAGMILIIMGMMRVGSFIKFIPYPVTIGFTSGIALIIFTSQVKDFFGLRIEQVPAEFLDKITVYLEYSHTANPWALVIGALALGVIIYWPRFVPKLPGSLAAIVLTTLVVQVFHLPVETIASRFGGVPNSLPVPQLPVITGELIRKMFHPAVTIALLAGIESLLSAVVADGMTGRRHRSNAEILAQGIANIASVFFGGIPATGAIARTATNIKNGAQTPVAGIVHAVTLLLIMVFLGRLAGLIPMPALAAILIIVAYNMSELHLFIKLFRCPRSDIVLLLLTFFLTVLIDLTVAIQTGVVLAAFLFMYRMSEVTQAGYITKSLQEEDDAEDPNAVDKRVIPAGVEVFEIYGAFFFGVVDTFKSMVRFDREKPKVFILRMRDVLSIDASGLKALEDLYDTARRDGTALVLSGVHTQPLFAMTKAGLLDTIGQENITSHIDHALHRAREILGLPAAAMPEPFVPTVSRDRPAR